SLPPPIVAHDPPGGLPVSFELLSHPADARFRATGATLEEAFAESTRAFAAISEEAATTPGGSRSRSSRRTARRSCSTTSRNSSSCRS
ncbi:archease, partial [Halomarina halobia]|uniref:archease n=1 Tax=Halomarina halobia TaxID=3033386 RepID=UPI0036185861